MATYNKDFTNTAAVPGLTEAGQGALTLKQEINTVAVPGLTEAGQLVTLKQEINTVAVPTVTEVFEDISPTRDPSKVFLYEQGVGYTDYTAEAIEDTPDDVLLLPDPVSALDTFYVAGTVTFSAIEVYVTTAGVGTYTLSFSYWNGSAWTTLIVAGANEINNWKSADHVFLAWDIPDDWAQVAVDGFTRYWIRFNYVSGTLTTQPLAGRIKILPSVITYEEAWSDTLAISDAGGLTLVLSMERAWSDAVVIADSFQTSWTGVLRWLDTMAISDTGGLRFDASIVFSDLVTIVDSLGLGLGVSFTDLMTIVDSLLWRGTYPSPIYLRFSAKRPQVTIVAKERYE